MKLFFALLTLSTSFYSQATGLAEKREWMRISDPAIMSVTMRSFSALPLQGRVTDPRKHWSSFYWPKNKGGINYRWNAPEPRGFGLPSPDRAEVGSMTEAELATLSPSEKWDIFNGHYHYPVKTKITAYADADAPDWFGICEGTAAAAMNHDEPAPIVVTNPDGISVSFGSEDIKALLSWYYANEYKDGYAYTGSRCRGEVGEERCQDDLNAGAFHLVLANRLGLAGKNFITDLQSNREVSNHLAYSYETKILESDLAPSETSAPGTERMVRLETTVQYVYNSAPSWLPVLHTPLQTYVYRTYSYDLDLDASGQVIGGEWLKAEKPDFLWLSMPVVKFKGMFKRLPEIL